MFNCLLIYVCVHKDACAYVCDMYLSIYLQSPEEYIKYFVAQVTAICRMHNLSYRCKDQNSVFFKIAQLAL